MLPSGEGPGGQALYAWDPSQSWPGGAQHDSRLDQLVSFWRAGLSLAEVFSAIEQQAGLKLGFWPEGNENRRVRVNLFLRQDRPPTLRELMVQLMWVTDCPFASAGDGESRAYYLLSTTLGQGLENASEEAARADREYWQEWRRRNQEEMLSRITVYAQALALSPDDLIAQYQGKDDYLLYNLLDPRRRAAVQYFCDLPQETRLALAREELVIRRDPGEFSPEERQLLEQAAGFQESWLKEGKVQFRIRSDGIMSYIGALIHRPGMPEEGDNAWDGIGMGQAWGWSADGRPTPREEVALRRLLGQQVTADQEKMLIEQLPQESASASRLHRQRAWEERRAKPRGLSLRMTERLLIPLALDQRHSPLLCELQEAVARELAVNVVSDTFVDLPRSLRPAPEGEITTAFDVLASACEGGLSREDLLREWEDPSVQAALAWEWGDAGDFLRFRSEHRDIWRAALLPEEALARFERWFAPYLEPEQLNRLQDGSLRVPLDLDAALWVASHLTQIQVRYGGYLWYGDPADEKEVWALGLRQYILNEMSCKPLYRLLATFSSRQWEQARKESLRVGTELSPSQQTIFREHQATWHPALSALGRRLEDCVMRIREGDAPRLPGDTSPPDPWHIEYVSNGKVEADRTLAFTLYAPLAGHILHSRRRPAS